MRHGPASDDTQHVHQIALARLPMQSLPERNHQVKYRVKEHRYRQQESAQHKPQRRPTFSSNVQHRGDNAFGPTTGLQAVTNDRRERDQQSDFSTRGSQPAGDPAKQRCVCGFDRGGVVRLANNL